MLLKFVVYGNKLQKNPIKMFPINEGMIKLKTGLVDFMHKLIGHINFLMPFNKLITKPPANAPNIIIAKATNV